MDDGTHEDRQQRRAAPASQPDDVERARDDRRRVGEQQRGADSEHSRKDVAPRAERDGESDPRWSGRARGGSEQWEHYEEAHGRSDAWVPTPTDSRKDRADQSPTSDAGRIADTRPAPADRAQSSASAEAQLGPGQEEYGYRTRPRSELGASREDGNPAQHGWGEPDSAPGQTSVHAAEADALDADYRRWRDQQMRQLDQEYRDWRQGRERAFSQAFDAWRRERGEAQRTAPAGASPQAAHASGEQSGGHHPEVAQSIGSAQSGGGVSGFDASSTAGAGGDTAGGA